jgi:hypothetical protein
VRPDRSKQWLLEDLRAQRNGVKKCMGPKDLGKVLYLGHKENSFMGKVYLNIYVKKKLPKDKMKQNCIKDPREER